MTLPGIWELFSHSLDVTDERSLTYYMGPARLFANSEAVITVLFGGHVLLFNFD